jgi:hypothetical protein
MYVDHPSRIAPGPSTTKAKDMYPYHPSPPSISIFVVATLATVIGPSILSTVVGLFQSRGAPMERFAVAERACQRRAYNSERQACMTEWLAASHPTSVAKR